MSSPMRVLIIGGVAAGPKTAARVARLNPEAEITVIEKGDFLSYAGCGLPYYVSGAVHERKELMATAAGVVRDAAFFQKVKNVRIRNATKALCIDRAAKRVGIAPASQAGDVPAEWLPYDTLVLCTGARPVIPLLPGMDRKQVHTLHSVEDADAVCARLSEGKGLKAVIVGGGLIGVEMAESLIARGCAVTVVERLPQILGILDENMAKLVERHMQAKGVRVLTNTAVEAILGRSGDDAAVGAVKTSAGDIPADFVIVSVGVRPNAELAKAAGLTLGEKTGAIVVDDRMRTSDPDILAAGDCAEVKHLVTGRGVFVPLGSTANKQGRVAANTICGVPDAFPGVLGSAVCRVFDFTVARTGLTEREARALGIDCTTVIVPGSDKAHFMPEAKSLILKLVADPKTRKLLGVQAVGPGAGDKRVDVAAMAITANMTVDQLAQADLCYAPPYSPAMDNILVAADVMRNRLDGLFGSLPAEAVIARRAAGEAMVLLDVRSPDEFAQGHIAGARHIPLGALRNRAGELPRDVPIMAYCKISLRGYEAARILNAAGFSNVSVIDGGLAVWPEALEK